MSGELGLLIRMARGEKVTVEEVARASMTPPSASSFASFSEGTSTPANSAQGTAKANGQPPLSLFGFEAASESASAVRGASAAESVKPQALTSNEPGNNVGVAYTFNNVPVTMSEYTRTCYPGTEDPPEGDSLQ
jgi:hypothetical protein